MSRQPRWDGHLVLIVHPAAGIITAPAPLTACPQPRADNIIRKLFLLLKLRRSQQFYPQCASHHYYDCYLLSFTILRVVLDFPPRFPPVGN
jgi:hypothetical protein